MDRIRILATSDVHGYIYPYSYANKKEENIGYARISALINSLRDENTILIDNGDNLEGSPLMYYHMHYNATEVCPVAKALNYIGYDYVNIGNHDYNYGEDTLLKYLNEVNAKCITSNVYYKDEVIGCPYIVKEINNKRIAIFGLTTDYIPNWESREHILNSKFVKALDSAKQTVSYLKENEHPDYIVCVYHGGFEKDLESGVPTEDLTGENVGYQMLEEIDGIDVLISGHQHRSLAGELFNTVYTQTKDRGVELACVDIYEDRIESRVIKVDSNPNLDLLPLIDEEEQQCQKWLDTPLGYSNVDLKILDEDEGRLHKSQVVTFLNLVSKSISGADLNSNALFDRVTGFNRDITMRDLVSTYVFPNTSVIKAITGKILKEYLEKCAEYFDVQNNQIIVSKSFLEPKPMKYNYDMVDGVEYTIKASNPIGQRIISLTRNGVPVKDDDKFTLCVNNYRASGGGNFNMIKNAPTVKEISTSMVEQLANYITYHKVIDFEPVDNIKVIV